MHVHMHCVCQSHSHSHSHIIYGVYGRWIYVYGLIIMNSHCKMKNKAQAITKPSSVDYIYTFYSLLFFSDINFFRSGLFYPIRSFHFKEIFAKKETV